MITKKTVVLMWILAILIPLCMLVLEERPAASALNAAEQPFANSVEQRAAMINELRAIRQLLSDQNVLLREQNKLLTEQLNLLKKAASGEPRRESDSASQTKK
jgi:hypothetical protein